MWCRSFLRARKKPGVFVTPGFISHGQAWFARRHMRNGCAKSNISGRSTENVPIRLFSAFRSVLFSFVFLAPGKTAVPKKQPDRPTTDEHLGCASEAGPTPNRFAAAKIIAGIEVGCVNVESMISSAELRAMKFTLGPGLLTSTHTEMRMSSRLFATISERF